MPIDALMLALKEMLPDALSGIVMQLDACIAKFTKVFSEYHAELRGATECGRKRMREAHLKRIRGVETAGLFRTVMSAPLTMYAAFEAIARSCADLALQALSGGTVYAASVGHSGMMTFMDIVTDRIPRWVDDELARADGAVKDILASTKGIKAKGLSVDTVKSKSAAILTSDDMSPSAPTFQEEAELGVVDLSDDEEDDTASTGGVFDLNPSAHLSPPELPRRVSLPTPVPEPFELMGAHENRPPEERMYSSLSHK